MLNVLFPPFVRFILFIFEANKKFGSNKARLNDKIVQQQPINLSKDDFNCGKMVSKYCRYVRETQ